MGLKDKIDYAFGYINAKKFDYISGCDITRDHKDLVELSGGKGLPSAYSAMRIGLRYGFDSSMVNLVEGMLENNTQKIHTSVVVMGICFFS